MSGILTFLHRSQAEIPRSEYLNIFSGERITPLANSSTEIVEAPWVERGGLDPLARSHQYHPRDTTDANQGANKAVGESHLLCNADEMFWFYRETEWCGSVCLLDLSVHSNSYETKINPNYI